MCAACYSLFSSSRQHDIITVISPLSKCDSLLLCLLTRIQYFSFSHNNTREWMPPPLFYFSTTLPSSGPYLAPLLSPLLISVQKKNAFQYLFIILHFTFLLFQCADTITTCWKRLHMLAHCVLPVLQQQKSRCLSTKTFHVCAFHNYGMYWYTK
jgi:hypothetical protein